MHLQKIQQKKNALKNQNFHSQICILVLYHHGKLDCYGIPCILLVCCTFLPIQPTHKNKISQTTTAIVCTYIRTSEQELICTLSHKGHIVMHELLFRVVIKFSGHFFTVICTIHFYSFICSYNLPLGHTSSSVLA